MQIDTLRHDSLAQYREQLIASLQLSADPRPSIYALVDHAFVHSGDIFSRWPGPRPRTANIMAHIPGAADCVSPLLVAIPTEGAARDQALDTLLWRCNGLAMLSFITSSWPMETLAKYLGVFTEVALPPDGQVFILRFADTRMIPAIADTLTPEQRLRFLAPVQQWAYLDRSANWVSIRGSAGDVIAPPGPFALSTAQFDSLMLTSLPDSLLPLLAEEFPDFAKQAPSMKYRKVKTWMMEAYFQAGGNAKPSACLAHCRSMLSV